MFGEFNATADSHIDTDIAGGAEAVVAGVAEGSSGVLHVDGGIEELIDEAVSGAGVGCCVGDGVGTDIQ